MLALGVGCERGCAAEELIELVARTLAEAGLAAGRGRRRLLARPQGRRAGGARPGRGARRAGALLRRRRPWRPRRRAWPIPSDVVFREVGATASPRARRWRRRGRAGADRAQDQVGARHLRVALAPAPIDAGDRRAPRGRLFVVGTGPGDRRPGARRRPRRGGRGERPRRLRPLPRSAGPPRRRQGAPRLRAGRGGGAGPPRPRPGGRGARRRAGLLRRSGHLRHGGPGLRAARNRGGRAGLAAGRGDRWCRASRPCRPRRRGSARPWATTSAPSRSPTC